MKRLFILIVSAFCLLAQAQAQTLGDQEIEARAREVGRSLRCVVCQNQSIDDSDAALAGDMRQLVRAQIREGKTNQEVIDFMQTRYGDYVLLKPPVQRNTYILWFAPLIVLLVMLLWYISRMRRKPEPQTVEPLSAAEQAQLSKLKDNNADQ